MKTIFKCKLYILDSQHISIPAGARFLCVQEQGTNLCLWALVDTKQPLTLRQIQIVGTGYIADGCFEEGYIGTVQMKDGYVWHVFDASVI